MMNITELTQEECVNVNGGASFAYRAGQAVSMIVGWNAAAGMPTTTGGFIAYCDWFL
ncbi:hypothetical protein [Williamwhitmania taraxaci]|uniref:Uncharacterized protein n=1 Tax=Williamwhitmania taraxaci TaxID=1640674 RepID=A0A1G6SH55_9BACT|nr:hypothetical protein [Williamwhitmania taraxaci]SDD16113.1 hypothetical protein SAMN05216323_109411 [Williamwhitmania taraxaci]